MDQVLEVFLILYYILDSSKKGWKIQLTSTASPYKGERLEARTRTIPVGFQRGPIGR